MIVIQSELRKHLIIKIEFDVISKRVNAELKN